MPISLTPEELANWRKYIYDVCGISLDESKGYLVETRFAGLLRDAGASSYSELLLKVRSDSTNAMRQKIIDAITTNETSFFRDTSPFEMLKFKILPDLIDRRGKVGGLRMPLRIWSAACSTGQEVYSTAIVLKELLGDLTKYDIRILGTDISNKAVAQASYGHYGKIEIERGLPPDTLGRYFTAAGDQWKIRDEIRALATFRTMNLMEPFTFPTPFDIVFCRNVAIYFNEADKTRIFKNIGRCLAKDGCLLIGSTESIAGICPEFIPKRYLRSVFYQLESAG